MDLFTEENNEVVTIDETKDYLNELVGEGRKFKSVEDLARGKAESDRYIEQLRARAEELEAELKTRTSLESFKTELEEIRRNVQPQKEPEIVTPDSTTVLDEARLEELVHSLLQKKEAERSQETNRQKIARVLEENFGGNAKAVLNAKAKELNISLSELESLAIKTPSVFFTVVGAQEGAVRPNKTGQVPSGNFVMNAQGYQEGARGRSYYERLKRENPTLYFDSSTELRMMEDMAKLGRDKFYNS